MVGKSETFRSYATHSEFLGSPVSRRMILQSISAIALTPVLADLALAAEAPGEVAARKSRPLRIDRRFVLFPINNEASSRRVRLVKNGRVLRSFTASLGLPAQWWAHLDVSEWRGQTLTLSIEPDNTPTPHPVMEVAGRGASETDNAELLAAVRTSRDIWSPETLYREPLRPQFHFSSRRGFNNDPAGLVYHNGQYHLFYQHNPYGLRWSSNMHWGHAVSSNLVHWKELPIALYPREGTTDLFAAGRVNRIDGDFPFTGSGVVDQENTSGWGRNGRPAMVIVFTSTGRGECIAYSNDDGVTWTEYQGNPIIRHELDGRDSKLSWHSQSRQWVIVVYSERPGEEPAAPRQSGFAFYTSPDLKSWQERSWIEGFFECPDLFALPIDGDANRMRWVLSDVRGTYYIGEFDGARFIPRSPRLPGPGGAGADDGYSPPPVNAAQVFNNHPEGHVVQIAWGVVGTTDAPFTQMMTFPTTLSLRTTSDGVRLCREPVDAIRSLRTRTHDFPPAVLTPSALLTELDGETWDIEAVFRMGEISPVLMSLGGDEYHYLAGSQTLRGPGGSVVVPISDGKLRLRILIDRTTVEIFGDLGQAYAMFVRSTPGGNAALALRTWGAYPDGLRVEQLSVHALRSAWTA